MSLIAHYRLNGDATDSVGGNDGIENGSFEYVSAKLGQGAEFDDTDGYISQSDVSEYLNNRREASISLWCKKNSLNYGFIQLSGYEDSNGNLYPYNEENRVYLDIFRTDRLGPIHLTSSTLEWHHVIITQKPGEWKLYQNGNLEYTANANDRVKTDYLQFEIGRNSNSRYADGIFDDVRIYDHALSEREVRDLSHGLVLHYPMNSEDSILDRSGQGNDGINYGATFIGEVAIGSGGYSFIGNNSEYIAVPDSTREGLQFSEEASICAWVKVPNNSATDGGTETGIFSFQGEDSGNNHYPWTDGLLYLSTFRNNRISSIDDNGFDKTRWHLLTITTKPGTNGWKLYQNDNLVTEQEGEPLVYLGEPMTLGWNSTGHYWTGSMCNVKLFSTALSSEQIKELYQQRASIDNEGSFHTPFIRDFSLFEEFEINPEQSDLWETFGLTHGSIDVDGGVCTITNETGGSSDFIGMFTTPFMLEVGGRFTVVSKGNSGRHATLFGFGTSPYDPFPHGGTGNTTGLTLYYRSSGSDLVSYRDENNSTFFDDDFPATGTNYNFEDYNTFEVVRRDKNIIEIYVNGKLESYYDDVLFENAYSLYFSLDGHTTPCSISIKQIIAKGVKFSVESTGTRFGHFSEVGPIDGAVGWWPLIKDTNDYVGTNDGELIGGELTGFGYETIDDADEYIDLGDSLYLEDSHPFSATGWMQLYTTSTRDMLLCRNDAVRNSSPYTWLLGTKSGSTLSAYDGSNWQDVSYDLPTNKWFHLTFSFDGTTMRYYVDGEQIGTNAYSFTDSTTGRNTQIGGYNSNSGDIDGKRRDVRFYNRALSAEEVAILYEMTNPESTTKVKQTADTVYARGQIIEQ